MNKSIATYLKVMGKKITSKKYRLQAQEEILNHFYDQIEKNLSEGKTWQESVDLVLSEATPAKELGTKLNLAHRPLFLRYPLAFYSASISVLLLCALIGVAHYSMDQANSYIQTRVASQKAYKDFFLDLKEIEEMVFINYGHKKSAHALISKSLNIYEKKESLLFSQKLFCQSVTKQDHCRFSKLVEKHGLELLNFLDKDKYQLSWVDSLLDYDHWNFFKDEIIQEKLSKANGADALTKIEVVSSLPIPHYFTFNLAVKLRVLELIKLKEFDKAQMVFDHAVQLLISSNTMVAKSMSGNMLQTKNKFLSQFKLSTWTPASEKLVRMMKRLSYGWTGALVHLGLSELHQDKIVQYFKPQTGACSGVFEVVSHVGYNELFFKNDFPFEPKINAAALNFRHKVEKMIEICHIPELKVFMSKAPYRNELGRLVNSFYYHDQENFVYRLFKDSTFDLNKIPYLRTMVGSYFAVHGLPHFFMPYHSEKWKRRPASLPTDSDSKLKSSGVKENKHPL